MFGGVVGGAESAVSVCVGAGVGQAAVDGRGDGCGARPAGAGSAARACFLLGAGGVCVLGCYAEAGQEFLLARVEVVIVDALGEQPSGGGWRKSGETCGRVQNVAVDLVPDGMVGDLPW